MVFTREELCIPNPIKYKVEWVSSSEDLNINIGDFIEINGIDNQNQPQIWYVIYQGMANTTDQVMWLDLVHPNTQLLRKLSTTYIKSAQHG